MTTTRSRAMKGLFLLAWLLCPSGAPAAEAPRVDCLRTADGAYAVDGSFEVAASEETAWSVLTDYEGISRFVPDVRESRVLERGPDGVVLRQAAVGRFFFFSRAATVTLRVREDAPRSIAFADLELDDFDRYEGSWTLEPAAGGTRVSYALVAVPAAAVPKPVARRALERGARRLLEHVQAEMERRQNGSAR